MSLDFTANFSLNGKPLGIGTGSIPGDDIPTEVQDLVNYYSGNSLGVKSLGVATWNSLTISVNGQNFTYTR